MTICAGIITYRLFFSLSKKTMNKTIRGKTCKGTHRAKQISYMLLILNLVFVLLLAPIVIGQIFQELNQEHHYRLYNSITILLSYSNHALNFVLYGIASRQFRLTLRQLLGLGNNDLTQRRLHTFGIFTSTGL
jgi:nitrogen fixation/metabolism regulation signal transduction histidine kinase